MTPPGNSAQSDSESVTIQGFRCENSDEAIRHPRYTSFLLWSMIQIMLLLNWITGVASVLGFCIPYCARIRREEQLMLHKFGDEYCEYMMHTKRLVPYIL